MNPGPRPIDRPEGDPERIPWWNTTLGEKEALACAQVVRHGQLGRGPRTEELEARLAQVLGVPAALCVPSGSAGLLLALMSLDIGPGDEVIVPDLTWIATAHAAVLLGARVVLVDCLPDRPVLDPDAAAAAVTPRTRAIVPVHLSGRAAPCTELRALCERRGIHLVEDATQALRSRGPQGALGTVEVIGVFSMGMSSLVSTGQGGVVVAREAVRFRRLQRGAQQGVVNDVGMEAYLHPGSNLEFTDLQAAVGLAQLEHLEQRVEHVRAVHERYAAGLAGLEGVRLEAFDLERGELPLWTEVRCRDRDHLRRGLCERHIETRLPHRPLHHAPHLGEGARDGDYPHAQRHASELLILPSGPSQPLENVDRVIDALVTDAGRRAA